MIIHNKVSKKIVPKVMKKVLFKEGKGGVSAASTLADPDWLYFPDGGILTTPDGEQLENI